jgi:hypothetical protein
MGEGGPPADGERDDEAAQAREQQCRGAEAQIFEYGVEPRAAHRRAQAGRIARRGTGRGREALVPGVKGVHGFHLAT